MYFTDCRFNVTGPSGFIRETDIPQNLSEYSIQQNVAIDCIWNITVAPGRKVSIYIGLPGKNNVKKVSEKPLTLIVLFRKKIFPNSPMLIHRIGFSCEL